MVVFLTGNWTSSYIVKLCTASMGELA